MFLGCQISATASRCLYAQPLPTYVIFVVETVTSMPRLCDLHFVGIPMRSKQLAINHSLHSSLRSLVFKLKNCSPEDFQCMFNIVGIFSSIITLGFSISDAMNIDGQSIPSPEELLKAGALPSYSPREAPLSSDHGPRPPLASATSPHPASHWCSAGRCPRSRSVAQNAQ